MRPTVPTLTHRVFSKGELEGILDRALAHPGEVHVVVAPPGAGKSTLLREILAERLDAASTQPLTSVLWATQSIHGGSSLGEEAHADFRSKGVGSGIVLPSDQLAPKPYRAQFDWPGSPFVKCVSHARLSHIFGSGHSFATRLAASDLLVIDEDPFGGLSVHASVESTPNVTIESLAATGHPVGRALSELAEMVALVGAPKTFLSIKGRSTGYGLSGELFWGAFDALPLGPADVPGLTAALESLGVQHAEAIAQAFYLDLESARRDPTRLSQRFGLAWDKDERVACLRFDVLPPLTFHLPVVVLDGYADEAYYQALFPDHRIHLHQFDPGPPLKVECAPMLKVAESREGTGLQVQSRLQIAEEIGLRFEEALQAVPPRVLLLLSNQTLRSEDSQWQGFLRLVFERTGLDATEMDKGHWHAGRGRNEHAGADIIAITRPYLNRRYRDHTLTALFPFDEKECRRLQSHLEGSEALQMLHRGRQTRAPAGGRPRVIFALGQSETRTLLSTFLDRVELSDYQPTLTFKPYSQKPRWRNGMLELVDELLAFFPRGLPRSLLQALPLHNGRSSRTEEIRERLEALARSLSPDTVLYRAFCEPDAWAVCD